MASDSVELRTRNISKDVFCYLEEDKYRGQLLDTATNQIL